MKKQGQILRSADQRREYFDDEWPDHFGWWWNIIPHYNFVVFSNYLTTEEQVEKQNCEIKSVFKALRNGGVVVILGATSDSYQRIYQIIDKFADEQNVKKIDWIPQKINCSYYDFHGKRIKQYYMKIRTHISQKMDTYNFETELTKCKAQDLWNPEVPYKSSKNFELRVYRKGRISNRKSAP
jgi:hypothetical protein